MTESGWLCSLCAFSKQFRLAHTPPFWRIHPSPGVRKCTSQATAERDHRERSASSSLWHKNLTATDSRISQGRKSKQRAGMWANSNKMTRVEQSILLAAARFLQLTLVAGRPGCFGTECCKMLGGLLRHGLGTVTVGLNPTAQTELPTNRKDSLFIPLQNWVGILCFLG